MKSVCGADCTNCEYGKSMGCLGCEKSHGCPFGKKCFIAEYIEKYGMEKFNQYKQKVISEFNALNVEGMSKITELYALCGGFVNLEYTLPSGEKVKLLDDNSIYLGNQVECEFNNDEIQKCYGLVAGNDFLLVCEYGENGINPEIVIFKRRQ